MKVAGSMRPLTTGDKQIGCYHVAPIGTRRGGLVLIQEISPRRQRLVVNARSKWRHSPACCVASSPTSSRMESA